jgi:hypothetical protein
MNKLLMQEGKQFLLEEEWKQENINSKDEEF